MLLGRALRLLSRVFAPLLTAQDVPGAMRMAVPQLAVVGALLAGATSILFATPFAIAAYLLALVAVLSLMAGYQLLSENDVLKERGARLSLRYEEEHPYFWRQFGYRIGIWNEGPATAEEVEVRLEGIAGHPTDPLLVLNVLPSRLGEKDGACQQDHCNINAGTEHYYDLLNLRNEQGVWLLLTIAKTRVVLLEEFTYVFSFVVSARNQIGPSALRPVVEVRPRNDGWLGVRAFSSRAAYDDTA